MAYNNVDMSASCSTAPQPQSPSAEGVMPAISDFIRKLDKILEDPSLQSIVCWGPLGDCFIVKDVNEFTKSVLPRMFKHSNFASFVRQLNKYDFHKVKNTDYDQFNWTFRHPYFHAARPDAHVHIKRKVSAQYKPQPSGASSTDSVPTAGNPSSASPYASQFSSNNNSPPYSLSSNSNSDQSLNRLNFRSPSPTQVRLTAEVQCLKDEGEDLRGRLRNLERDYDSVLAEVVNFHKGMTQQDWLMQNFITYFLGNETGV